MSKSTENHPHIEEGSFSRHARSLRHETAQDPASKEYPSLTVKGVEQSRETVRENFLERIRNAPPGTLMFIGGKSDQERTGETGQVYGEELKKYEAQENFIVLTKKEIDEIASSRLKAGEEEKEGSDWSAILRATRAIKELIRNNPDKKIVIDYPLTIKQLGYSYNDRWTKGDKKTEYFSQLLKRHNNDHAESIADWMQTQGELTMPDGRKVKGPLPEDVAKEYLQGLSRLYRFTREQVPDRPIAVHGVGHQWDLDAVVTYLAKGGVTYEDFLDAMGRPEGNPTLC